MKNTFVPIAAAAILSGLAACGGASSATDPAFVAATPSYDLVALSVDDSDSAIPAATTVTSELQERQEQDGGTGEACHPHLFARTRQVVLNLNILSYKLLSHVAQLTANHESLDAGATLTWERTGPAGIQRRFTLTKNSDGSFIYELDFAAAGSTSFVKVFSGESTNTEASAADAGTAQLAETKGNMTFDFTALGSIVTAEKESGQITYTFDVTRDPSKAGKGVKRSVTVGFTNFMFGPNDPHGARNGSYSYLGEPGVGGTLAYQDSIALLCPANPNGLDASTVTEARWYLDATDGLIHGRADAKATGGQISILDVWEGTSCHEGPAPTIANEDGYWMMKLEDSSGATAQGSSVENSTTGAPACDPLFGAVPSLTSNATDYVFGSSLTFPNEW